MDGPRVFSSRMLRMISRPPPRRTWHSKLLGKLALAAATGAAVVQPGCVTPRTAESELGQGAQDAGAFYTVRTGDRLEDIAARAGLSAAEIAEVNGLNSAADITPGQVIFIPAGAFGLDEPRHSARLPPRSGPASASSDSSPTTRAKHDSPTLTWPLDGVVLRGFSTGRTLHEGLLIAAPANQPILAAADGEVLFTGDQGTAFGLVVVLRHADELVTVYGHLAGTDIRVGDRVRVGARIGVVGTSGGQESPRLHFQVRRGRTPIDPLPLLSPP